MVNYRYIVYKNVVELAKCLLLPGPNVDPFVDVDDEVAQVALFAVDDGIFAHMYVTKPKVYIVVHCSTGQSGQMSVAVGELQHVGCAGLP